jgi:hypothetical protein
MYVCMYTRQYGDKLHLSVIAKNFLGHRVTSCAASVSGSSDTKGIERYREVQSSVQYSVQYRALRHTYMY